MTFADYKQAVETLPYGKRLPTARYVFTDAESPLPEPLAELVQKVRQRFSPDGPHNLIKFHTESLKISLLHYPGFFDEPHPALSEAVVVDLVTGQAKTLAYSGKDNPPILHRKETMLPPGHPQTVEFAELSTAEEKHGLYRQTSRIGFKQNWEKLLREKGLKYQGHRLVQATQPPAEAAGGSLLDQLPPGLRVLTPLDSPFLSITLQAMSLKTRHLPHAARKALANRPIAAFGTVLVQAKSSEQWRKNNFSGLA